MVVTMKSDFSMYLASLVRFMGTNLMLLFFQSL